MKNSKNKRTNSLLIILLALLVFAYKVMFMDSNSDPIVSSAGGQSEVVIRTLQELDSIDFDISFVADGKFNTLKSLEIPLPQLPVGKKNPFSKNSN